MFFTYLMGPTERISAEQAQERFSKILGAQALLLEQATGNLPEKKIWTIGDILVGQLYRPPGIKGWSPYSEENSKTVVWNGICENFLSEIPPRNGAEKIYYTLEKEPEQIFKWDGNFYVVAWDSNKQKIILATAATEIPPLWYVEGPDGWAIGPRAVPLLNMVNQKVEPDLDALNFFAGFENGGGKSFFKHVERIADRKVVVIEQRKKPIQRVYISLGDYLTSDTVPTSWDNIITQAGNRITKRVKTQLQYSNDPRILLSGGTDSRCIAAAVYNSGIPCPAVTSGKSDLPDLYSASVVADSLNIQHQYLGTWIDFEKVMEHYDRLKLWVKLSEGMERISHVFPFKEYILQQLPIQMQRPSLHGGEPGMYKGVWYPELDVLSRKTLDDLHDLVRKKVHMRIRFKKGAEEILQETFVDIDDFFINENARPDQWIDLYLWRVANNNWTLKSMSVKSVTGWRWLPLYDRELIRLAWQVSPADKKTNRFLNEVIISMAPMLKDIPYVSTKKSKLIQYMDRAVSRINVLFPMSMKKKEQEENKVLGEFWKMSLLNQKEDHIWQEFVDYEKVLHLIKYYPNDATLWRLLTLDLTVQVHC